LYILFQKFNSYAVVFSKFSVFDKYSYINIHSSFEHNVISDLCQAVMLGSITDNFGCLTVLRAAS